MTEQEKNIEIALMIGIIVEQPYPPNKDYNQHGYLFRIPNDMAKRLGELYNTTTILKFHSDYNWQFEAIEFVEKLGFEVLIVGHRNWKSGQRVFISDFRNKEQIRTDSEIKKKAIFEALFLFSQTLK